MNEYLTSAKGLLIGWYSKAQLPPIRWPWCKMTETRGKEVRERRAYTDDEIQALLNVAGRRRIVYLMAILTGIRHGELKRLRWSD